MELSDTTLELRRRLADVLAVIAELENDAADLKAQLRARLPVGEHTVGGVKALTITANRRFSPALAEEVVPAELLALCKVEKVDPATARKVLPPWLYEQAMTEVGERVVRLA